MTTLIEALFGDLTLSSVFAIAIRITIAIGSGLILLRLNRFIFKKITKNNEIHLKFLKSIVSGVICVYTVYQTGVQIPALQEFMKALLTSSSLLVAVAGFAAQESLSNVINGLFISIFKPFNIGDRIKMVSNNISGYVEDITLRHTVVRTFNNSRILVPNSLMNSELIENTEYKEATASMWIDIGISYDSDIEKAKSLMAEVIASHPLVIDRRSDEDIANNKPKVTVLVRELAASSIQLRASVWTSDTDSNFTACSDIRQKIKEVFDENGIVIPYNHMTFDGTISLESKIR